MAKTRQFYSKTPICEGKVRIEREEARHIHVLRLKPGDKIELFDDKGNYGLGTIEKMGKKGVEVNITQVRKVRKHPISRVLASAAPKNKRFDVLLQKATEIGVDVFIPIITKRSVVKPSETKIDRLKKIAIEAAKQCRRKTVPEIKKAITVEELIKNSSEYHFKLIADVKGKKIKEVLRSVTRKNKVFCAQKNQNFSCEPKKILCLIGPEGGFTDEEIKTALEKGFIAVNLGKNILRVETAGICILSTINYEYFL
ncbi:RsmE family RNA methyltransferase [Candidatus Woesearchaeota archaeon]|nr:RsmE family RNA methyltransferase [Candidatus Woesearchaeota archaeon]